MDVDVSSENERALRECSAELERLRTGLRLANVALWEWDPSTNEVVFSAEAASQIGYAEHEIGGTYDAWVSRLHPDDFEPHRRQLEQYLADPSHPFMNEFRLRHRDGSYRWILSQASMERDTNGKPLRMLGSHIDITERKRAQEARTQAELALKERELRLTLAIEGANLGTWHLNLRTSEVVWSKRTLEIFGLRPDEPMTYERFLSALHPDDRGHIDEAVQRAVRDGTAYDSEMRLIWPDGSLRWIVAKGQASYDDAGAPLSMEGVALDITPRKLAEQALRESKERLTAALRASGLGTWVWDIAHDCVIWDEAMMQLAGQTSEQAAQLDTESAVALVYPDDREAARAAVEPVFAGKTNEYEFEHRLQRPDGNIIWLVSKGRLERDADGKPSRMVGACVDVTRQKQLEDRLRQAQKMEAIGQLAGGVAHDFNNLLTVILGHASLLRASTSLPSAARESMQEIAHAAERAGSLTAQLLAFGRRQVMRREDVDLREVIESIRSMLERMLTSDIALVVEPSESPVLVNADPHMLTQVLLNLAVNARDAMPRGGSLRVRTCVEQVDEATARAIRDASPGTWACICVTDTGSGIREDILPHLFEPFFTTKPVGKGSGLGLSMVYGIVTQHHGWLAVESPPDQGATFKIFLPLLERASGAQTAEARAAMPERQPARGETILLVEDDAAVRTLLGHVLQDSGYRLLTARTGAEALRVWKDKSASIQLLLTDIVMPEGLSGCEMAEKMLAERPNLKMLMSSGFSIEALDNEMLMRPGVRFLQKPYAMDELLGVVREVLDAP